MSDPGTGRGQTKGFYQKVREFVTPEGLLGTLVFLIAFVGVGYLIKADFDNLSKEWSLPILALSSVLLLLGSLLVFTTLIRLIGLSDPKSALGLPEGSVRALLALALLGLFAIMASSVLVAAAPHEVKGLLATDIDAMVKANPDRTDISWIPEKSVAGQPQMFTAIISSAKIDDFGKQMLTLVGTLMTAVISFYFGSVTGTSSTSAGANTPQSNPTGVSPSTAKKGTPQAYTIIGTHLNDVKRVEALPEGGGTPVVADAKSTDTEVMFTLTLPEKGKWTLHLHTTSGGQSALALPIDVTD